MKSRDTRTPEQEELLDKLLTYLTYSFGAPISAHNYYTNAKACPSFKAKIEYAYINENLNHMRMVANPDHLTGVLCFYLSIAGTLTVTKGVKDYSKER